MNDDRSIYDTLADKFDQAWQRNERPSIDSFLSEVPDSEQDALLRLLLPIDIEYRRRRGDPVSPTVYQPQGDLVHTLAVELLAKSDSALMETNVTNPSNASSGDAPTASLSNDNNQKSQVIGPYKLLQVLGEGGMGTVWMAEQTEPVRRRVALKLIKAGADNREIIARFEAERQALAMMDHPNIAKVLDAGAAEDGSPYFVMELVQGIAINEYCDRNRLTPDQRLEVLIPVCRAVQHAHLKGIIHRDLKPSNVMVAMHDGKPVAKVIDFGLAKALQHQTWLTDKTMFTQFGQVVGTPQYMSPEQATLDEVNVDTRSDVYSLGVILYELLAGSTPIQTDMMREHALLKVLELIREQEPQRPSDRVSTAGDQQQTIGEHRQVQPVKLRQILSGDLDWIVMKALDKDRARRYESASSFADDIQRYLNRDAIHARPPSQLYKFRKFIGKHKGLAAAASTILLLLIAGIAGTTLGMVRADSAMKTAETNESLAVTKTAEALAEKQRADTESEKSQLAAQKAIAAEKLTKLSRDEAETSLARSKLFLADARWDQERPVAARQLLNDIPPKHRNVEWYLSQREFIGSDKTAYGHTDQVSGVAYSPDGALIASTSHDGTLRIWDATSARLLRTIPDPKSAYLNCVAFSKDSTLVASGGADGSVRIWDVETATEQQTLPGHTSVVTSLSFAPDGQSLISAGMDVRIWDIETGKERRKITAHNERVTDIAISANGNLLATCSFSGIKMWDLKSGDELEQIEANGKKLAFSGDDKHLLGSDSRAIVVWDTETRERTLALTGPPGTFTCLAYSDDGKLIASCIWGSSVISIWDVANENEIRRLVGHSGVVEDIAFSPDSKHLVSGSRDGEIKSWQLSTAATRSSFLPDTSATSVVVAPDSKRIATQSLGRNMIQLWDSASGLELMQLKGKPLSVGANIAFSPDGSIVATPSSINTIERWNTTTGKLLPSLTGHDTKILCVSFSPDGKYIASGGADGVTRLWDSDTGKGLRVLTGHKSRVNSAAFSPDGSILVTGGMDSFIKFWDLKTGKETISVSGPTGAAHRIVFSPDGKQIATGNWENTIEIRDTITGSKRSTLRGHTQPITSLAYSPDGSRLVSGSLDKTIKIWDAVSGSELKTLGNYTAQINSISFSKDGTLMATNSAGLVMVDRLTTTNQIFSGHRGLVRKATFSPNDRHVATLDDQVIRIWDVAVPGEFRVLRGNDAEIMQLAFSKDGQHIVSRDLSGALLIWDTDTGVLVEDTKWKSKAPIRHLSSDGRLAISVVGSDVLLLTNVDHESL